MKKILSLLLVSVMLFGIAGCKTENAGTDGKLQVYTSFYAMYDFAKLIAGDAADVHLMCPAGAEPHDYEPTAIETAKLTEADIFIYNGNGMEHWADKLASTLDGVTVVCASEGIVSESANDPHVWLDPQNAYLQLQKIHAAFVAADGANAEKYDANLANCAGMIKELDMAYADVISAAPMDTIVVAHGAYSYLCDAYGIEQLAIESASGESDPSPAALAQIIDSARAKGIKYVCAEEMNSSKVVDTVAKEIGAETVELNPFEASADSKGYFDVMYDNLEVLKRILN